MNINKLKSKRVEKGLNQNTMANNLDITVKTYSLKENAKADFTRWEICRISNILQLNLSDVNEIFFNNNLPNR